MSKSHPYWGADLIDFIQIFFARFLQFIRGDLTTEQLASDEIQIVVLALIGCSSALVGTFLVLKRMTMLANSLSHTVLLGIVVAYLIAIPFAPVGKEHLESISIQTLLIAALATACLTTVLTQGLTHVMKLQEDASIGLVFTTLFALSIVLVTCFTRNTHIGTEAVMGNIDALHLHDIKLALWIAILDLILIGALFKGFKLVAFDSHLASSLGFSPHLFNYLMMLLTSATAIAAFRAVGVLLLLAFIVGPVLTARLYTYRLKRMIALSIGIALGCSWLSVALSRHLLTVYHAPLSTSGLLVVLIGGAFGVSLILVSWRRIFKIQKKSPHVFKENR
jgi:manganese/zinc/iron transport system permease protein